MKKLYNVQPKFMKAVLMMAVMLFLVAPAAVKAQSAVDGSEEHPIPIYNAEQLIALATCHNSAAQYYYNSDDGIIQTANPGTGHGFLIRGNNGSIHYKLMADIDLNPNKDVAGCDGVDNGFVEWSPIGVTGKVFYAQFDGNYHIISGVYVNKPTQSQKGFFGMMTSNSSVKNLGIVNSYISGKDDVGGIVGSLTNATVTHCFVDATVVGSRHCGGVVGYSQAAEGFSRIDTCYAAGSVSSFSDHVGGVVGGSKATYVTSCYSSVVVNYTAPNQIGGILGYDDGGSVVVNSYYDRQMCPANTPYGVGKWTNDMVQSFWTDLGENYLFAYAGTNDDYYPSLKGFSQTNMSVRLSTLPIILSGEQTMADVRENFTVSGKNDGFTWVSSDNTAAEVTVVYGNYSVVVKRQAWFMLKASYGTLTHTVAMYSAKDPAIGTEANPFTINNMDDLAKFRDGINSGSPFEYQHFVIPARGNNTYFLQTANITLPDANWNGSSRKIGKTANEAFAGIYDGGGHEVQGLKVTSGSYAGFFGYVQYGTIKNLGVRVKQFTASGLYGGPLCAIIQGGTIENCYSTPENSDVILQLNNRCGGLIGYAERDTVRIIGCYNECDIVTYGDAVQTDLGGIISGNHGQDLPYIYIYNCCNKGNITGKASYCGGVAGIIYLSSSSSAEVSHCRNEGNITNTYMPQNNSDERTAGVLGYTNLNSQMKLSYCSNTGNITVYAYAAGILGPGSCYVDYCYNTGDITIVEEGQPRVDNVAGISVSGKNRYCLNLGKVTAGRGASAIGIGSYAQHCFNAGEVTASMSVGTNAAYGVNTSTGNSSNYNINIGGVYGQYTYRGPIGTVDNNFVDVQMVPASTVTSYGTPKTTSAMLGTGLQSKLGDEHWVYTEGMYPRIKGLENEDAMIVAASPVCLVTGETVNGVSSNFTVSGCDSSVVWTKDGNLVTNITGCTHNSSNVSVADDPVAGANTLTATRNGVSKTVRLNSAVAPAGVLDVANLADLKTLRDGVNTGAPFEYHSVLVPAGAQGTTFRQTASNIDLSSETNWEPIGTEEAPFRGIYNGNGDTISHLTQSDMTNSGLFGVTQKSKIHHLTLTEVNISNIHTTAGTFITVAIEDTLSYCYAHGRISGNETSGIMAVTHVGGLVGKSQLVRIENCGNYCSVTGGARACAGGLIGYAEATGAPTSANASKNRIVNSFNAGEITGNYMVGGLVGRGSRIYDSYNYGNIIANTDAIYVGGLSGANTYVESSFNTGKVTVANCAAGQDTYVGGLVAYQGSSTNYNIVDSYNAGIIEGANRKHVGGLVGAIAGDYRGSISTSYNLNAVNGNGEFVGAILGYNIQVDNSNITNNYYDQAFCQKGGLKGEDVAGKAEAKTTAELTNGTTLPSGFSSTKWTAAAGYYPRVASIATADASLASAAKLQLPDGETAQAVSNDVDLATGGCVDNVTWGLESGNSISFTPSTCTGHVVSRGVVYVVASVSSVPYKLVKVNAGISENSPLIIKSKAELVNFRNLVNAGATFYYNESDQTYHADDEGGYFAITNQGEDLYFKLTCDVNLSDGVWTPIGLNEDGKHFNGHFNGDNHTITGLQLTSNGSYQGLFGYLENGSIRNINVEKSKMAGEGNSRGFVCGYNDAGVIDHCSTHLDTIVVTSGSAVGGICGTSLGAVQNCSSDHDTISSSTTTLVGGICGVGRNGSISNCNVQNLAMVTDASYTGGVCGRVFKNLIDNCQIKNSSLKMSKAYVGGICGYDSLSTIQYCSFVNTNMESASNSGGIVGYAWGYNTAANPSGITNYIRKCYTDGGSIEAPNGECVGGIIGQSYRTSYIRVVGCQNNIPVHGKRHVGGVVGEAQGYVDSCVNTAAVHGEYTLAESVKESYCGGVVGYLYDGASYCRWLVNFGDVTGEGNRVGGIVGHNMGSQLMMSFNSGRVVGQDYVGGIAGRSGAREIDCYNAGQVFGGSFVGGIAGAQFVTAYSNGLSRCYNIGHVQGNSITGAICGYNQNDAYLIGNFYDKQFSYSIGVNGVDLVGHAEGKLTSEMVGEGLKETLGVTNTTISGSPYDSWLYANGIYPQVKYVRNQAWGKDGSVVSATPIIMPATVTSWNIPSAEPPAIYGAGSDTTSWSVLDGEFALEINDHVHFTIKNVGVAEVAASAHDSIYKRVRIVIGVSEESPIIIKDYNELCNFRDGINSNRKFYYDAATQTFWTSQDGTHSRIEIPEGGDGMFFRLENAIDMGTYEGTWTPIGKRDTCTFKGHFNGNGKAIAGMTVTNAGNDGNYHGLFGYNTGTLKNVILTNASVVGSNRTGILCGYNRGTLTHCSVIGGTVTGSSSYTGGICGQSENGSITECYNTSVVTGRSYVGGIAGQTAGGVTSLCFNAGKVATPTGSYNYCGGISGYNTSFMSDCYNTGIVSGVDYVGGVVGYNGTSQFARLYSAGQVTGTGSHVGAICNATSASYFPQNAAFDTRMIPGCGAIGSLDPNNQSKYTEQMHGDGLQSLLGTDNWTYTDSLYPQLTVFVGEDASYVSVTPIFLQGAQTTLDVTSPFMAYNKNEVNWDYVVPTDVVNLTTANQPESGRVIVENCGPVSLKVVKNLALRQIDLVVQNVSAGEYNDTTCGGEYLWTVNNRYYSSTGDYIEPVEIGPGCNQITTLHLVVPDPLAITMEAGDVVCYGQNNGHITPHVTGCFGTYTYEWSKEGDASFSSTADELTGLQPGTYTVVVTDATKTNCTVSASVTISEPTELTVTNTTFDSHCWNDNDGEVSFNIAGGITPYTITWTTPSSGSANQSLAGTYSMSGLPDGEYDFVVKDANECSVSNTVEIADDDTPYAITAYGIDKLYDGVSVNPNRYILKINDGAPDTLAAGVDKLLANGDTLKVTVSQTTALVNVGVTPNNLTNVVIKRGTEDVTCRYHLIQTNSTVNIRKRNVTLTSATAEKEYDGEPLVNSTVAVTGDGFATGEGCTFNVTGTQTEGGSSLNTFTYTLNEGTNPDNYSITKVEGVLTVNQTGTVIVTLLTASKMYDGTALVGNYAVSGVSDGHHAVVTFTAPSITNAGTVNYTLNTSDVVILNADDEDVTSTYVNGIHITPGTLTITPREITLISNTASKTYDGMELYDHAVSISGDSDVDIFASQISDLSAYAAAPVIDYTATPVDNTIHFTPISGYVADNYTITYSTGTLTINKKSASYKGDTLIEPYTGSLQCAESFTVSGLLTGHTFSGVTYSACGTNAGTYNGTFTGTPVVMNGSADVTANYDLTAVPATLTINPGEVEIVITSATMSDVYYDGQNHTMQEYTVTYNGTAIDHEAGNVFSFVLPTGDNLKITPANYGATGITDVADGPQINDFTYNLQNEENYSTDAVTTQKGTLELEKRLVTIRSKSWTQSYTGQEVRKDEITIAGMGFVSGEGIDASATDWTYMDAHPCIDVDTFNNVFDYVLTSATDPNNYDITKEYGKIIINKVTLTVTADNKSRPYGNENPEFTYQMSGFVTGEDEDIVRAAGKMTGEPVLTTTATSTTSTGSSYVIEIAQGTLAATNYNFYFVNGTLAITARQIHINALPVTATYDGTVHTWEESAAPHYVIPDPTELRSGDEITNVVISGNAREAGSNVGGVSVTGITIMNGEVNETSNYQPVYTAADITIAKRPLKIVVGDGTVEYDGNPHSGDAIPSPKYTIDPSTSLAPTDAITTIDIIGGGTEASATPYDVYVNMSTLHIENSELDHTINMKGSYEIVVDTGDLTITPLATVTVNVKGRTDTVTYDGVSHTVTGYDLSCENALFDLTTVSFTGTPEVTGTNADTYTYTLAATDFSSTDANFTTVEFNIERNVVLVIKKKAVTITANDWEVMYDGETHTYAENTGAILTVTGLVSGHTVADTTMTGSGVDANTYDITPAGAVIKDASNNVVTDNYEITYVEGLLTITPRTPVTVIIQEHGAEYEYDGTLKTVSGYSVSVSDPLYLESYITFGGTSTVSGVGSETVLTTYQMELQGSDFSNNSANFTGVTFTVLDSALYIYPKLKAEVTGLVSDLCLGGDNGAATINVTGGKTINGKYNFSLNGGTAAAFTAPHTFDHLSVNDYTVVITDSLNYSVTVTFSIEGSTDVLTATIVTPTDLCPNQVNYPVSVNVSGGTAPYTYTWTGAQDVDASATQVVQTEVNDGGTAYAVSVSILDANSCPIEANTTFTVKPSVTKTTSLSNIVCPADMDITLRYGVYDTLLTLTEPTWTSNITEMPLTLVNDAPASRRFGVREGREDSTYTIHWHLVDTCGGDSLICTQTIIVRFPACTSVTVDDHTYQAVRLGANCWTRSNLQTPVPPTRSSANGEYKYNNDDALAAQFGLLYSWYAACRLPEGSSAEPTMVDGHVQGMCPTGWALPTAEDYIIMVDAIGGIPYMKITDSNFWISGLEGTAPSSGFDALGAGYYKSTTDSFEGLMTVARFWTATPTGSSDTGTAIQCEVCEGEDVLIAPKSDGYSIRCVRVQ